MGGKWWTTAHATRWQERVALVSPERPWTADPNLALGFARKSDAEAYMLYMDMSSLAKATEHIWIEARTRSLASECDALRAQNAELVAALGAISALKGKTLLCGSYASGDDASKAYSLGANRAFDQCADIARAALAAAGHKQGSGK